jgi:hypothetical protein
MSYSLVEGADGLGLCYCRRFFLKGGGGILLNFAIVF